MPDITLNLTQTEATTMLMRNVTSLDHFKDELVEAGKNGNTDRVVQIAAIIKSLESINIKLSKAGVELE